MAFTSINNPNLDPFPSSSEARRTSLETRHPLRVRRQEEEEKEEEQRHKLMTSGLLTTKSPPCTRWVLWRRRTSPAKDEDTGVVIETRLLTCGASFVFACLFTATAVILLPVVSELWKGATLIWAALGIFRPV
jgi:hypothetical protein